MVTITQKRMRSPEARGNESNSLTCTWTSETRVAWEERPRRGRLQETSVRTTTRFARSSSFFPRRQILRLSSLSVQWVTIVFSIENFKYALPRNELHVYHQRDNKKTTEKRSRKKVHANKESGMTLQPNRPKWSPYLLSLWVPSRRKMWTTGPPIWTQDKKKNVSVLLFTSFSQM